jgi:arylformamidase
LKIQGQFKNKEKFSIDTQQGINLTQAILRNVKSVPNAYFLSHPRFETVISGGFVGDVTKGGACNCEDIHFNAHGNGTHTECVGHISAESIYMTQIEIDPYLNCFLVNAQAEELSNGDRIVNLSSFDWDSIPSCEAVIINSGTTKRADYFSGNNPCYLETEVLALLHKKRINHVLTDLPSVDKEDDGGALAGHKAFFGYPNETNLTKTISELLYIPKDIENGKYVVSIRFASIETDAVPSTITIYSNLA